MKTQTIFRSFALVLTLVFAVAFSSCEKVKDLAKFDISYSNPDVRFTLDSLDYMPKSEVLLHQVTLNVNLDSIIAKYELDGIENAKFESVKIEIESPASANFSWLTSARVTLSTQGVNETEVAATTSISPDGRSADIAVTNTEVISQISGGVFTLKLYGSITPPLPAVSIGMLLKSKIKMTVKPL